MKKSLMENFIFVQCIVNSILAFLEKDGVDVPKCRVQVPGNTTSLNIKAHTDCPVEMMLRRTK